MKPPLPPAKRRVHSFEPDADLCLQLDAVIARGYKLGFVINAALLMGIAYVAQNFAKLNLTIGGWPAAGLTADTLLGAVVASVLLSLITAVVGLVVRD